MPAHCGIVSVLDGHPATLAWLGAVYGHRVRGLGVEHFGQTGSLADLYRHYGIDANAIVAAAESIAPGPPDPPSEGVGLTRETARQACRARHRGKLTFRRQPGNQAAIQSEDWNMPKHLPLIAAAALALAVSPAAAQSAADYPNKPVRVLVTVPPGGGVDTVTRLVTGRMAAKLGQTFVVENRGGAGGSLAAEAVFKADPDGYQLMASQPAPITTNVALYKSLNYDPAKFQFVGIMSTIPNVLLVKNDFPAKTAKEFIGLREGQSRQGELRIPGSRHDVAPHRRALRQADRLEDDARSLQGHRPRAQRHRGGPRRLHLHAARVGDQAARGRQGAHPRGHDEQAHPAGARCADHGRSSASPASSRTPGTPSQRRPARPRPIVNKLNAALNDVLKEPELTERFKQLLLTPGSGNVAETRAFIEEDTKRWIDVINEANIPKI